MDINDIDGIYVLSYSATGNTRKIAETVGRTISSSTGRPLTCIDYNSPDIRSGSIGFSKDELVVVGFPTYRGKLPMYISDDLRSMVKGDNTPVIEVITYGNRSFDNSLADLTSIMNNNGLNPFCAATFPCQHAYTRMLATGRPNDDDIGSAEKFAKISMDILPDIDQNGAGLDVPGIADAPFYIPLGTDGGPVSIVEVKPVTDIGRCTNCGKCADICPLGSIDCGSVSIVSGPCIKCQACIRGCPADAKSFMDVQYSSHVKQLEEKHRDRKEIEFFFPGSFSSNIMT